MTADASAARCVRPAGARRVRDVRNQAGAGRNTGALMDAEEEIGRLRAAGQLKDVATLAIEGYGPEVLSFLEMMLRDHADASDAFAQACEDLWKGLPRFEGRSSMKTWCYTLARHATSRLKRSTHPGRHGALSEITDVAERVRSRTRPHLRTEIKHGFAAIRDALDDDDRMLL